MRILADENIPLETVRALRAAGHDVYAASERAVGATDDALLQAATAEQRLLITFDRDFREMATRRSGAAPGGVLLLRLTPRSAEEVSALVLELLARSDLEWAHHVSVLDRSHLRQRPLRK